MSGSIYCADLYCEDCTNEIENDARENGTVQRLIECGADISDAYTYDSDEYPKRCDVLGESDCPQHCGGCGAFLENALTSDGDDYVIEIVRFDLAAGSDDSIAVTVWMPFYDYINYDLDIDWEV